MILRPDCSTSRPILAFRVGVTGARDLSTSDSSRLRSEVSDLLQSIKETLNVALVEQAFYLTSANHGSTPAPALLLRFLSPLARGADRLSAAIALDLGFELHVPMPFPQKLYEKDFVDPDDLSEFRHLLSAASSFLEFDGDPDSARDQSYEAAGRYVVRNCDLLIAIWDGERDGGGRGGTAETIRFAASAGVPIWWVHSKQDTKPRWLADVQDIRDPRSETLQAAEAVRVYISKLIVPPAPALRHHHGLTDRLAHFGKSQEFAPMSEYFDQAPPEKQVIFWRAYDSFMQVMAGCVFTSKKEKEPRSHDRVPSDPVAEFWFTRYLPADRLAAEYADRYRSGYVWTFLFATLSVVFGASSLLHPVSGYDVIWTLAFISAELMMLILTLLIVGYGIRQDWHEHSIEFRLLAELCRKQQALGPLGWTLPILDVRALAIEEGEAMNRGAWVAWLFAADQRASPFPKGMLADAVQGSARKAILKDVLAEQQSYHSKRAELDGRAAHNLARVGELFFFSVLFLVILKLSSTVIGYLPTESWLFGLLATVLPAISAAFVGIRAYAEVPLLATQSRHMLASLKAAQARVERLTVGRPLVSQDLGSEAASVATLMLQDLDGWARLFRVKALETG